MKTMCDAWPAAILIALCGVSTGFAQNVEEGSSKPEATDAPVPQNTPAEQSPADEPANADTSPQSQEPESTDDPADEETQPDDGVSEEAFLQDPFTFLQSDMQSAVVDLKDGETKPPANVTQPRILTRFGLLIEQLERQGQGAGQAGQRPSRPAQQSSLKRGPGGQNEMRAPRDDGRDWADLSPQERQKILQSKTDGFPAGYDEILADYFRRVARAQEATAPGADASGPVETANDSESN